MSVFHLSKRLALTGMGVLSLAAAAPSLAQAQPYGDRYVGAGGGEITVQAPGIRYRTDPFTGEAIMRQSRAVYYGDLDLSSDWGMRTLHSRVVRAALQVCRNLDYEAGAGAIDEDTDNCVRPAVVNAMAQAPAPGYLRYRYEYVGYEY